ncbi:MAG: polyphosphate polymerase domain-containing protein [Clostridia bacterium]|nr:polyphosphate polymerase domain-containing protein [Clostridia bacterium]
MAVQTVFKRYEFKYLVNTEQKEKIISTISQYMQPDKYGHGTVRNIYFDTDNYLLIRRSIEKPVYKEKLRIRSYGKTDTESKVFVELKKKYKSVVYKRRIVLPQNEAMAWVCGNNDCSKPSQIKNEIDYFINFYKTLHPAVFLSYEREAYAARDGSDFRVTFDENILCRQNDLSLCSEVYGTPILQGGMSIMEIKCSGGIPLWMTELLSRERIFKTPFSKYGTAYKNLIFKKDKITEVIKNA